MKTEVRDFAVLVAGLVAPQTMHRLQLAFHVLCGRPVAYGLTIEGCLHLGQDTVVSDCYFSSTEEATDAA